MTVRLHPIVRKTTRTFCPECGSRLVFARMMDGMDIYCEDCGWPEECLPEAPACVVCKRPGVGTCGDQWRCEDHWIPNACLTLHGDEPC